MPLYKRERYLFRPKIKVTYSTDMERRQKLRVGFKTQIALKIEGSEIRVTGSSKDLSLTGIFIHTKEQVREGMKCQVGVTLSGMDQPLDLSMEGAIVRSDPAGLAVAFESMDLDTYTHLKNIIRYNTDVPDEVH
jgi:hypothetical protein